MQIKIQGTVLSPQQQTAFQAYASRGCRIPRVWCLLAVDGELDSALLHHRLERAVSRHEALRARFRYAVGLTLPLQDFPVEGHVTWLGGETASSLESAVAFPVDAEGQPSVVAASFACAASGERRLALAVSALAADAASLALLVRVLGGEGEEGEENEPPQYGDVAGWWHDVLAGEESGRAAEIWQGATGPALALPWERAEGWREPLRLRRLSGSPQPDLAASVAAAAAALGADEDIVVGALWRALLSRHAEGREGAIEAAFSGRRFQELDSAIGLYVRFLPLRVGGEASESLRDWVRRCAAAHQEAEIWQDHYPPKPADGPAGGYAFDFLEEMPAVRCGDATIRPLDYDAPILPHVARLSVRRQAEGLRLSLCYDQARLPEPAARCLVGQLEVLIRQAARAPDAPLSSFNLLGPSERSELLFERNATSADFSPTTLHEAVLRQALATPERIAVVLGDRHLSYRELARRAEGVAGGLSRRGIVPEARVGIRVERSPEMVVSILGTLLAGAAYLPLDSGTPKERLDFMLADAEAGLILVSGAESRELPVSIPNLSVDAMGACEVGEPGAARAGEVGLDRLAYVIYTSGSTGRPKGVMVSHGAIANRLLWMQSTQPFGERDAIVNKTPISFDASIWEIFSPLICGARLVLVEPGGHQDMAHLAAVVARHQVTALQLVPSLLRSFLDRPESADLGTLRRVYCGGEALAADLVARFFGRFGDAVELHNLYGPTETSIDAAYHRCTRRPGRVPIGRPIANLRLLVVDPALEPVSCGAQGELAVGGFGLARGYLGRSDLTAERFVPDPFSGLPGERLYRTGDLASPHPEGFIDYRGRADGQVKIRGVRVEPGEVEAVLREHSEVLEAVVGVRFERGTDRLVGWIMPQPGSRCDHRELRAYLRARLPEVMVPSVLSRLEALPRTVSGKVDRAALSAPDWSEGSAEPAAAPITPTAEILAGIWTDVLGLQKVGQRDNFFEIGGDSILSLQVIARAADFGIELSAREMFQHQTVEALAGAASAKRTGASPIARAAPGDLYPVSFPQEHLWFLDQIDPEGAAYNIPSAIEFSGRFDVASLAGAMTEIVRRHQTLRTVFESVDGRPWQRVLPAEPAPLPVLCLARLPAERAQAEGRRISAAQARGGFDLARGPVWRLWIVRMEAHRHLVAFAVHHVASDGWSMEVLTRELLALYVALGDGRPSPLPPLPIQYVDFATWQRDRLAGSRLEEQLAFWRQRLAGAPSEIALPFDRSLSRATGWRGAIHEFEIEADVAAGLRRLARVEGATLFMVAVACFDALLANWCGETDLVVGTDLAGRDQPETQGLIGFFVNQTVLRVDAGGNPTLRQLVSRVKDAALAAYEHADVPFSALVKLLAPNRELARSPLFQVKLVLQTQRPPAIPIDGVSIRAVEAETGAAKFDLLLNLVQGAGAMLGSLEYRTDLFETDTAEWFGAAFAAAARGVAETPDLRLSDLAEILREGDLERARRRAVALDELRGRSLRTARRQAVAV